MWYEDERVAWVGQEALAGRRGGDDGGFTYPETSLSTGCGILELVSAVELSGRRRGSWGRAYLVSQRADDLVVDVLDGERASKRLARRHCTLQAPERAAGSM